MAALPLYQGLPLNTQQLKSKFEDAVEHYRQGRPLYQTLSFNLPNFEEQWLNRYQELKLRQNNLLLQEYYYLGLYLHLSDKPTQEGNRAHNIGSFLYLYFQDEPQALAHLQDVSPNNIHRLSQQSREIMLASRPKPLTLSPTSTLMVQGLNQPSPGEMWHHGPNSPLLVPEPLSAPIEWSPRTIDKLFNIPSTPLSPSKNPFPNEPPLFPLLFSSYTPPNNPPYSPRPSKRLRTADPDP
jgi:hypothetical protein